MNNHGIERNRKAWGGTIYIDPDQEPILTPTPTQPRLRPVHPCSGCKHGIGATQDFWTVEGKNLCSACFEASYPGWRASWGRP